MPLLQGCEMEWIKIENCTPDKPEVHALAEYLKIAPEHALGCLVRFWCWADQQSIDGNALSVTDALLARVTGVTQFAQGLRKVGWLSGENGNLSIPNFDRHNGQTSKRRALTAKRQYRYRRNATVTQGASPEKSREEKNNNNPPKPPLLGGVRGRKRGEPKRYGEPKP
jgi:hypothetical protein